MNLSIISESKPNLKIIYDEFKHNERIETQSFPDFKIWDTKKRRTLPEERVEELGFREISLDKAADTEMDS